MPGDVLSASASGTARKDCLTARGDRNSLAKLRYILAVAVLTSLMSLPRSFVAVKLVLIAALLAIECVGLLSGRVLRVHLRVLFFYGFVALFGIVWSFVGIVNGAEPLAIVDTLRLYVGWSVAYVLLVTILCNSDGLLVFHRAALASAFIIVFLNFAGLLDQYLQWGLMSISMRESLDLFVGFHDGYIQITSHNIGTLFFLVPYLLMFHFRNDARSIASVWTWAALILALLLVAVSGRRALWISCLIAPVIAVGLGMATSSMAVWRAGLRRGAMPAMAACLLAIGSLGWLMDFELETPLIDHVSSAFSAEDERTIQRGFLIDSFAGSPVFGTGFGIGAGYVRNDERPWIYELTYQQLLMNVGLVGYILVGMIFLGYLRIVLLHADGIGPRSAIAQSLLLGLLVFLIGSYSNPYLGSFDFLLVLAVLPFLSTRPQLRSMGNDECLLPARL